MGSLLHGCCNCWQCAKIAYHVVVSILFLHPSPWGFRHMAVYREWIDSWPSDVWKKPSITFLQILVDSNFNSDEYLDFRRQDSSWIKDFQIRDSYPAHQPVEFITIANVETVYSSAPLSQSDCSYECINRRSPPPFQLFIRYAKAIAASD